MAIKKVRIKPPGYTDIVHPETQADITKYNNTNSELVATNVQSAIDEINTKIEENKTEIVDGLTSTDATKVLSAKQGKVLKDLVDSKWVYDEDTIKNVKVNNAVNADTVNGKTVESNVPPNAKFTDTTYSEISTSEIDAGTSSTLRTISGRRIKYILDKVQGWINALTKADIGLNNVDNVKQASKTEFDTHNNDSTRHITSDERTKWNTVDNKVDKVTGKGLSTNDYTTAEKNKLSGIQAGAQVNTVTSVAGKTGAITLSKSDVGLGSVSNYGLATQAEAEAGTSSAKYMTPLRTKQAINVLQAVKSVAGKTGTVTLTKGDVGLSNVDNTSDMDKPISTATQTVLNLKANLASPAFTGTPTAPTASNGTNTNQIATTAFVQNALSTGGYGDMLKSQFATNAKVTSGYVDKAILADSATNAEKVNGFSVGVNVPAGAKFTDTTYSEITTSEIDAGTSSTLRTISGRRIKYILDKVQGWIGNLTKADVGLNNVDNVKQATKVEFDEHLADTMPHLFTDGTKTYKWGLKAVNGIVIMKYEEVV